MIYECVSTRFDGARSFRWPMGSVSRAVYISGRLSRIGTGLEHWGPAVTWVGVVAKLGILVTFPPAAFAFRLVSLEEVRQVVRGLRPGRMAIEREE